MIPMFLSQIHPRVIPMVPLRGAHRARAAVAAEAASSAPGESLGEAAEWTYLGSWRGWDGMISWDWDDGCLHT